ncbi:sugar phosphate isomerase/epimerase family protein [Gimesia aquarii]|uniref:Xylose isomerase-like TIM barrel n=1 Tax=Gimesia aquarii TaxID=2527964 RepID=A0A517W1I4_9PLAN|nr:sugar phosphate isomerase/epimerase family protein [Gimesia aquarii]QDT99107.1 Xylose isomerase-like TIM barrel [Gimesia aquarii]
MTKELLSQRKVNSFSSPTSSIECQNTNHSISLFDRISVHQITTYHWSLKESLLGLCSTGIPAIGLWNRKILDVEPDLAAELIIDSKLKVSTISLAGGFTGGNEYSFKEAISDAIEIIKFGGQVNAAAVQVVSGPRAGHTRNHAKQLTIDALKQLGDVAALHGTKLALKSMPLSLGKNWTFLNSLDSVLETIEACNHPAVGIAIDSTQICHENNVQDLVSEIIPMITAVQISGFTPGKTPQQSFSNFDLIEAIDHAGYDGFFDLEIWSEQVWHSDYLSLLSQLQLACQTELSSEF